MYQDYSAIREEMAVAAYGRDYKDIEEHATVWHTISYTHSVIAPTMLQALQPQECVPLLLSVYEVYTMSRASTNIAKQLLPEVKQNDCIWMCQHRKFSYYRQLRR